MNKPDLPTPEPLPDNLSGLETHAIETLAVHTVHWRCDAHTGPETSGRESPRPSEELEDGFSSVQGAAGRRLAGSAAARRVRSGTWYNKRTWKRQIRQGISTRIVRIFTAGKIDKVARIGGTRMMAMRDTGKSF